MIQKKIPIYLAVIITMLAFMPYSEAAQPFSFGLRGNFNGAKFVWNENTNASISEKIGLGGGLSATYRLNRLISLQGEALFDQKGAEVLQAYSQKDVISGILYDHYNTSSTRLNYLAFPLTVNFSLPIYRPVIRIYFGLYGAFLLTGEQVVTASASSGNIQVDSAYYTPESAFRKNDYGLVLGGSIPMGKLELGGSYSIGFPRILRSDIEDINQYVDYRNRVLSFTVGYRIR